VLEIQDVSLRQRILLEILVFFILLLLMMFILIGFLAWGSTQDATIASSLGIYIIGGSLNIPLAWGQVSSNIKWFITSKNYELEQV
jgi:hypothetical protein